MAISQILRYIRRRLNWCCFIVFSLIVVAAAAAGIGIVALTVKPPKLGIAGAMVTNLGVGALQATITAEVILKNPNVGRFDYRNTTVNFFHEGDVVGQASVPGSKAARKSTKKMILVVPLDFNATAGPKLWTDLSAGVLPITISAGMKGRVVGMERSTSLNCAMQIVTATQSITNLLCE